MDTRISPDFPAADEPQTVDEMAKHLRNAASVWLGTIGKGDIIRQMKCRGETINVTTSDLQRTARLIEDQDHRIKQLKVQIENLGGTPEPA
ncbi:MAG: hypothetical protein KAI73_05105 [Rhodospirillaceae bacterium]|nr:hypothetical protein [Rhodospirillaceae bacterium]